MHHSALSRSWTIELAQFPQTPYICKTTVTNPDVSNPTVSSTPPPSKIQGTPATIVELAHDTNDAMTVVDIRSAMKRVRKYLVSSAKPVRKLFETPTSSQLTIVSTYPTLKMNFILGNVFSTDRTSYHGNFQFIDDQIAFNLYFWINSIPFTLSSSHKVSKYNSVHVSLKIATYVNTFQVFLFCDIIEQPYVGTNDYDSRSILLDVEAVLSKLNLDFTL